MSYRYDFFADALDGRIELPKEIASRLGHKGITRLRVSISTVADEEGLLAERGIDRDIIDRVASAQSFDPDVATVVLRGEGATHGTELANRLLELLPPAEEASR